MLNEELSANTACSTKGNRKGKTGRNVFFERTVALPSLNKTVTVSFSSEAERHTLDMLQGFGALGCTAGCVGQAKSFENSSMRSESLKG